jgi:hypothetical protein
MLVPIVIGHAPTIAQDKEGHHVEQLDRLDGAGGGRMIIQPTFSLICDAIRRRAVVEFDYGELHRIVEPYCHGTTSTGLETLRAIQIGGESRGRLITSGKLWTVAKMRNLKVSPKTFAPDDPNYNPQDVAMVTIHCRI